MQGIRPHKHQFKRNSGDNWWFIDSDYCYICGTPRVKRRYPTETRRLPADWCVNKIKPYIIGKPKQGVHYEGAARLKVSGEAARLLRRAMSR